MIVHFLLPQTFPHLLTVSALHTCGGSSWLVFFQTFACLLDREIRANRSSAMK